MRPRRCLPLAWALAASMAIGANAADAGDEVPDGLRSAHPGRAVAVRLTEQGAALLSGSDDTETAREALSLLWAAAENDPLLSAAWINLSAAYIRTCQPRRALFAAMTARLIDPSVPAAAKNLALARDLDCPTPSEDDEIAAAEWDALQGMARHEAWRQLAARHRSAGRPLLAVLFERFALDRGGPRAPIAADVAADLARAGMLRAAIAVLSASPGEGSAERARELAARADALRPTAESIGSDVAHRFGLRRPEQIGHLVQVSEVMLARGLGVQDVAEQFETWYRSRATPRARGAFGSLEVGPLWHPVQLPGNDGWPLLLVRRFPGDTQLALFAWPARSGAGSTPGDFVARQLRARGASRQGEWRPCAVAEGLTCRRAPYEMDLGFEGRGEIDVFLVGIDGEGLSGVAIALVGDAGCADVCAREARKDLERLVATWRPPERSSAGPAAPQWRVPTPRAWQAAREHSESERPWRSFPLGDDARIDLPPGLAVATVEGTFASADATPHTRLWMRGAFRDRDGGLVTIGDARVGGTIDVILAGAEGDGDVSTRPPPADPDARFVASADLGAPLRRAGTGSSGSVARFKGGRFSGTWLVFRSVLAESSRTVEIRLPIARGRDSLSLLWIPLTARDGTAMPPPPLVDLSESFEIRFQPLTDTSSHVDPRGGWLIADELRVAVPREARVSLNSDARDGFPVTLRGADGLTGRVDRWAPADGADAESRCSQASAYEGGPPLGGWSDGDRTRGGRVYAARFAARGADEPRERCVAVLVPRSPGERPAFRVRLVRGDDVSDAWWKTACELTRTSLQYRTR